MWLDHQGVTKEERISLYKLIIARSDISEALFATQLFLKTIHSLKDEGYSYLQNSIVVSYCRPFKRSQPYGPLPKEDWPGLSEKRLQKVHDKLLLHRDTIVAHSDADRRRVQILPPGTSKLLGEKESNKFLAIQAATHVLTPDYMPLIEELCLDVGGRLNTKVESELERMYGKMNLPNCEFDLLEQQE